MMPTQRTGTRTLVLRLIRSGVAKRCELCRAVGLDPANSMIEWHLNILRRAGLVAYDGRAQRYFPGPMV